MTGPQSPRDRILWMLTNNSDRIERSRLRRCTRIMLADLNLIQVELTRGMEAVLEVRL